MGLTRRALIKRGAGLAATAGALGGQGSPAWASLAGDGETGAQTVGVTVTEATNASVAVARDGQRVVLDLLNIVWALPADGGEAVPLTSVEEEASEPDFSPDGERIVYTAYTGGTFQLWLMNADGSGRRQLTSGFADHREPRFSPGGDRLACAAETGGRYAIHVIDIEAGVTTVWTTGTAQEGQPCWTPDGTAIAFTTGTDDAPQAIDQVSADGSRRTLATVTEGRLAGPSLSPDGSRLAYVHLTTTGTALVVDGERLTDDGEDVFPFAARWAGPEELLYTADGKLRRRTLQGAVKDVPFSARVTVPKVAERPAARDFDGTRSRQVKGIVGPALSPDGTAVAFGALGDLWLMRRGRAPEAVVADGHRNTDPAWSPDGRTLIHVSDRDGGIALWSHDLATGARRRLTDTGLAAAAPTVSPDGTAVAFISDGTTLSTLDLTSGAVRKVAGPLKAPGRPTFTADGKRLSAAVLVPATPRFREGRNQILTVDLTTGEAHYSEPLPGGSLTNRIDAGPVHAPDGTRTAYIANGTLHISDLDATGRTIGTARQVSAETADAPSWSGDSGSLLYLCDGHLRLVAAEPGARPAAVPLRLTWRPALPTGRTVIQAGALWDGTGPVLRHEVDIVLDGHRIAAVTTCGAHRTRPGDKVVDARGLTVLPGLVAVHEHGPWERNELMRLWLSFGITALRSPGTAHYAAVEAKETLAAGRRTGPRVFTAGEMVDGSRIYYSSARPITDDDQLRREIRKALALGHDMVKTYVRLPYSRQRRAIQAAHRVGLRTTSHYLFGPLGMGADGVEHIGGTSRYGRRQKETHLGHSYQDVTVPLAASGMAFTPTFGLSGLGLPAVRAALYRHAEWALDDPRLTSLLTAAEYTELRDGVEAARADEPTAELAFVARHGETVCRLIDQGAHIAVGTDSPLVPPGVYYHLNLQTMIRHGVSPYEALRSATVQGARALGLSDHLGTVEPGKLADLVLVEGDPTKDIAAAAAVRQVVVGGTPHTVADLLETAVKRSGPTVRNAALPDVPRQPAHDRFWWHRQEHIPHSCC
ncbi:amidohydrolase family protein [Streptomyces sp. TRM68367]|uniref:amidohydrolase family protein n=1 Tax=Streptomyces sp. TRM68367 TaxID=2758415 RepID=UPI00165C0DCD|nr:amidohydrolase family protein [Streptomyces sp. TRM68367]MBC9729421.1 PD40 domain-containing protein [Streptomyces sp. TRM68367]